MDSERSGAASVAVAAAPLEWLRAVGIVLAASAFVAACAHIAVPLYFTPVPLTLQPFAVLLLGLLLSPRLAAASLVAYLGEGALGLPVFAPGAASVPGLAHLFGPTAGYLLAYPFAALLISYLYRRTGRGPVERGCGQPADFVGRRLVAGDVHARFRCRGPDAGGRSVSSR
jgi:biotin transport system substrate-specific component